MPRRVVCMLTAAAVWLSAVFGLPARALLAAPNTFADIIADVAVTDGKLLGEFNPNKTFYYVNVDGTKIPTVTPIFYSSDTDCVQVNAKALGESTTIEITDSQNQKRTYVFQMTKVEEGVYYYSVVNNGITTFAAATFSVGREETLYMVCTVFDSKNRVKKVKVVQVILVKGSWVYKARTTVGSNDRVKVIFLRDLHSIMPVCGIKSY